MNPQQFRIHIVEPTLKEIGLYSKSAEHLLMCTAAVESGFEYIQQIGGVARGFFQMEPNTIRDLEANLSESKAKLLYKWKPATLSCEGALRGCMEFMVVAARLQYWRFPEPLPQIGDEDGFWRYYKKYWNTQDGATTEDKFFAACQKYLS